MGDRLCAENLLVSQVSREAWRVFRLRALFGLLSVALLGLATHSAAAPRGPAVASSLPAKSTAKPPSRRKPEPLKSAKRKAPVKATTATAAAPPDSSAKRGAPTGKPPPSLAKTSKPV